MKENGFGKGIFWGFLAGSVVGGITALLFAPKSGKELRSDIRDKAEDFLDDAEQFMEKAKDKANEIINDGKKKSERLVIEARQKVDSLIEDAEQILSEAKIKAGGAVNTGRSAIEKESERLKNAVKAGVDTYKKEKEGNNLKDNYNI
jgi:gas vesicle protein